MKVETVQASTDAAATGTKRTPTDRTGSTGSGGQNGGGGGDYGGKKSGSDLFEESDNYQDKFRIGMWFILLVVMMTFGGLIAAYVVIATNAALEWNPVDLPGPVLISTFLLISSSFTLHFSNRALAGEDQAKAKNLLLTTTILGGMFIASQILAWVELVNRGVYLASNPYAGFFYILTAVHALHVLGGIITLGYIVLRSWEPTGNSVELKRRRTFSGVTGWYWHFMGGLWIILLLMLGFWR